MIRSQSRTPLVLWGCAAAPLRCHSGGGRLANLGPRSSQALVPRPLPSAPPICARPRRSKHAMAAWAKLAPHVDMSLGAAVSFASCRASGAAQQASLFLCSPWQRSPNPPAAGACGDTGSRRRGRRATAHRRRGARRRRQRAVDAHLARHAAGGLAGGSSAAGKGADREARGLVGTRAACRVLAAGGTARAGVG